MVQEILAKVVLDTKQAEQEFDELKKKGNSTISDIEKNEVKLKVDTKDAVNQVSNLNGTFGKLRQSLTGANGISSAIAGAFGGLVVGAIGSISSAIAGLGSKIIDSTAKFQRFETVLTNTLGSNSKAKKALDDIVLFAATTPFQVDELTDSFIRFANRGINLTLEEMTKLGDIASSQGKSFNQLTEAILDAQTGEFERLKEFGIRASKEGDKVTLSFKGITKEVANNELAIKNAIISYGDLEGVAGGMAAISKTLGGQLSNLSDNVDLLFKSLGESLAPSISAVTAGLNSLISSANSFIQIPQSEKILEEKNALNVLVESIRDVNTSNESREVLMKTLNDTYPEFTKLVDVSKASDVELAKALAETNRQYDNRIYLLATTEATEKYTKKIIETIEAESELQKKINENEISYKKRSAASKVLSKDAEIELAGIQVFKREQDRVRERRKQLEAELNATKKAIRDVAVAAGVDVNKKMPTEETATTSISPTKKSDAQLKKEEDAAEKLKQQKIKNDKEAEKAKNKAIFDAAQELQKIQDEIENANYKNDFDRQRQQIRDEYFLKIETNKDLEEELIKIREAKIKKIDDEELKIEEEKQKKLDDYLDQRLEDAAKAQLENWQQEKKNINSVGEVLGDAYKRGFETAEDYQKRVAELLKQLIEESSQGILISIGINPQDADRLTKSLTDIYQKIKDGKPIDAGEIAETAGSAYFAVSNAIAASDAQRRQEELAALQTQQEEELRLAGDNEQKKEIIKQKYALKEREVKRRQAEADKRKAILDATVNTAVAVIKTFATMGFGPGLVPAALMAALGAAQIAFISAQPIPKFEKGGAVPSSDINGMISGRPHAAGGVLIEAEGNEFITRRSQAMKGDNLGLLEAINMSDSERDAYINRHYVMPALQAKESQAAQNYRSSIIEAENNLIARVSSHTLKSIHREQKNTTDAIKRLDKKDFKW